MAKKSLLVILVLVLIFSAFSVYSQSQLSFLVTNACAPENTVLKLSSNFNAHASAFDQGDYNWKVCYGGTAPQTSHTCTANNKILKLSSQTNAHAQVATRNTYTVPVCYGNLNCVAAADCTNGYTCLAKLSSQTNAHVSSCSLSNYPVKICCKSADAPQQGCTSNSECLSGICSSGACIPSPPIEPQIGPTEEITETCETTSECGDSQVCVLNIGEGGTCQICNTQDVDGDGILDCSGNDPCVGTLSSACLADDLGLSCNDLNGRVCGSRQTCENGEFSTSSTELNCCVATGNQNVGCRSAQIFLREGSSVQYIKECLDDGRTQVSVVNSDGALVTDYEELGITVNPYIDNTDYSCSNVDLGGSGERVPAFGLIGLSVTLLFLTIFYFYRNRKLLKY